MALKGKCHGDKIHPWLLFMTTELSFCVRRQCASGDQLWATAFSPCFWDLPGASGWPLADIPDAG